MKKDKSTLSIRDGEKSSCSNISLDGFTSSPSHKSIDLTPERIGPEGGSAASVYKSSLDMTIGDGQQHKNSYGQGVGGSGRAMWNPVHQQQHQRSGLDELLSAKSIAPSKNENKQ